MTLKKRLDRLAAQTIKDDCKLKVIFIAGVDRDEEGNLKPVSCSPLFVGPNIQADNLVWEEGSSDETLEAFEERCLKLLERR